MALKKFFPKNVERITSELIDQSEEFNWEGISFPTKVN